MNKTVTCNLDNYTAETKPLRDKLLGGLLILEALLSFAPVAILGAAIGWPASLSKPAPDQLNAIYANANAVTLGYSVYLLYSILIAPVMIGLARRVLPSNKHGAGSTLANTVIAFAALSALARAIGILRWLTVMPALAALHASADAQSQAQINLVFTAITLYGGGIGEVLGVSIFMALSLGTLSIAAGFRNTMPKWLAGFGALSALALGLLALPTLGGPAIVPVAAAVTVLTMWMLAAGVWIWCFRAKAG